MKTRVASISFLIAFLLLPVIAVGQEQRNGMPERNSLYWFHFDADYYSKPLLLKLLQFTAPYPGFYQQTVLETDGKTFTARHVPNWAVQNSSYAKLDDAVVAQIKQMLAQLNVPSTPAVVEPEYNRLHSAFVFYDGQNYLRFNYNGPNPPEIEAIVGILRKAFMRAEVTREEEIAAHRKLMLETYGDWQNRPGITINAASMVHGCKGNSALVVLTAGQRKAVAASAPAKVSLYHALVFYPLAAVVGSGSGGGWSDDPVQSNVVIWRVPNANGSFSESTSQQRIEILHNAIDATVTIAGKKYQLTDGNMFVIRIGADWQPTVTQLKEVFEEQATAQASLDRFKAVYKNDTSIQKLELY